MDISMSATARAVKEVMGARDEVVRRVHGVLCGLVGTATCVAAWQTVRGRPAKPSGVLIAGIEWLGITAEPIRHIADWIQPRAEVVEGVGLSLMMAAMALAFGVQPSRSRAHGSAWLGLALVAEAAGVLSGVGWFFGFLVLCTVFRRIAAADWGGYPAALILLGLVGWAGPLLWLIDT